MIDRQPPPGSRVGGLTFETRIAACALATAVAVLALASGLFIYVQWRVDRTQIDRGLEVLTQVLGQNVGWAIDHKDPDSARADIDALAVAPAVREVEVISPSGQPWLRYGSGGLVPGEYLITRKTALIQGGREVGVLLMRVQPPAFSRLAPRYIALCGALFFAAVAIALLLGRVLARRVVHPVNRLSEAIRDVTERGDYSRRVPDWAGDEFGVLTDSFNTLLAQLQANDTALHKAMSDLVEARNAAQATNVLKSQFLANMSHEVRTPLNGVLTMAEIMAMGELSPAQRARIDVIRRSGQDLANVLNDILDLSKIQADMVTLEEDLLDLPGLKARLEALHAPAAAEKGVGFSIALTPAALAPRRGDQARLLRILTNLISNALKFTPKGEVAVLLDGQGEGGREGLKFSVQDTGVGIARETLPLLFQTFSQADGSNTRRFGGAGLGLAICRELTRMMDGQIQVESVEGEGSTFTVTLPLAVIDPAASEAASQPSAPPPRVLAAEDIPTSQMVLRTILESFGAEFEVVGDGARALEAWRAGGFDLILMDIQMPVMDGVAATRAIRAEEVRTGRPRTPIIAISANALPHHVRAYLDCGMDGHVPKPISLNALHAAMSKVMDGARFTHVGGR